MGYFGRTHHCVDWTAQPAILQCSGSETDTVLVCGWMSQSSKKMKENFSHLCCDQAAPQSDSSGLWSQCAFEVAAGEWVSIKTWPGTGWESCHFHGCLLEFPPGPSSLTAPLVKLSSGVGLEQRTGLLFPGPPLVMDTGCVTGADLPPSLPDHHSVKPKPENHENMS